MYCIESNDFCKGTESEISIMKVYQITLNNEKSCAFATMDLDCNKRLQRKLGGKPNRQLAVTAAAVILFTLFSCFQECICATGTYTKPFMLVGKIYVVLPTIKRIELYFTCNACE